MLAARFAGERESVTKRGNAGAPNRRVALRRSPPAKRAFSGPEKAVPAEPPRRSKAPTRSLVMRLAAEVERLAAQLQHSRARVSDLEAMIEIDPLTELLNRRGFERELKRALAYVRRYGTSAALAFIDLDAFKPVNDRHGHAAGDAVLKAVAATLTRHVRASDIVARLGGDEFVVLLWNVTEEAAIAKAAALETMIATAPVRCGNATVTVGASAGVAPIGPADTAAELLGRADAAMYARKCARKRETDSSPRVRETGGATR
jgi:diguanylate cyclase (GGDEF)-like protein